LFLQDLSWWTGTHEGMISSDLHEGSKPTDGRWNPSQGGKKRLKACTMKEEGVGFGGTLAGLNNERPPFPTWTLALETLDVTLVAP
jgi:hypothetical protein